MAAKSKPDAPAGIVHPQLLLAIRLFTLAAIATGCYLAWISFTGMSAVGCGPSSGCQEVLRSRWAYWFGVPVSAFALAVDATVMAMSFRLGRKAPPPLQRQAWCVLVPCAVVLLGAAVWFVMLQLLVIKKVCPFCMTAHGFGSIAAILLLRAAPIRAAPEVEWQRDKQVFVLPALAKKLCLAAGLPVVLLIAGQVWHPPRSYVVQAYGGKWQFDLAEVPLIGPATMTNILVSLYDYTCHSCREMHWQLMEAYGSFSNQMAIVSLPMPLCERCNPLVKVAPPIHSNACEYARAGLAIWRADRRKLHPFDEWVFKHYFAPPLTQAWAYAGQLVGSNAFAQALQDPWVEQQLQRDLALYATNSALLGRGDMPQLIIGTNVIFGTLGEVGNLKQAISDGLRLKPAR